MRKWLAGTAAAALLACLSLAGQTDTPPAWVALVVNVRGTATVQGRPVHTLSRLSAGDTLDVPAHASATLSYIRGGARVQVSGPARLAIALSPPAQSADVRVERPSQYDAAYMPQGTNADRLGGASNFNQPRIQRAAPPGALAAPATQSAAGGGGGNHGNSAELNLPAPSLKKAEAAGAAQNEVGAQVPAPLYTVDPRHAQVPVHAGSRFAMVHLMMPGGNVHDIRCPVVGGHAQLSVAGLGASGIRCVVTDAGGAAAWHVAILGPGEQAQLETAVDAATRRYQRTRDGSVFVLLASRLEERGAYTVAEDQLKALGPRFPEAGLNGLVTRVSQDEEEALTQATAAAR